MLLNLFQTVLFGSVMPFTATSSAENEEWALS